MNFIQKIIKLFFWCNCMEVQVPRCWNGAAYMTRKWTCILLNVKLSAVNARAIWMPKLVLPKMIFL